jgi:phosphoribosylformylglycinamidine synthase
MKSFKAKITITLRENILDVQGKTIEHALHSLEYNDINHIRIGKFVELMVNAESDSLALERVKSACSQLIANPIVEDYFVSIEEVNN